MPLQAPALSDVATWSCPDCSGDAAPAPIPAPGARSDLVAAIRAIESDNTLSEQDKARRRQAILAAPADSPDDADAGDHLKEILDTFNCVFCPSDLSL
jgi:E3 ubiquitin-protein ligase UHRF1